MLLASWSINSIRARQEEAYARKLEKCTAAFIDRNERKGRQPSDHAPTLATFDLP